MALFNKNKEEKKHKGENIVGKIIYIFLLFAPLFSILTTSLYTIFNKNAYESYYGQTINEKEYKKLNDENEIKINEYYNIYIPNGEPIQTYASGLLSVVEVSNISTNYGTEIDPSTVYAFYIAYNQSINADVFTVYRTNLSTLYIDLVNNYVSMDFKLIQIASFNGWDYYYKYLSKIEYNKYSFLDNSFDYGIYKTEQNNLFNWAKDTGTYTIMKTTTDGLEINNTFIPMLLTYWLIISVIYFIYDIALMLIWILHRKIHELTESV